MGMLKIYRALANGEALPAQALHLASAAGHIDIVGELLRHGADHAAVNKVRAGRHTGSLTPVKLVIQQ